VSIRRSPWNSALGASCAFLLAACATSERVKRHVPDDARGLPIRDGHIHGGTASESPPDYILLTAPGDSTLRILASAEPIANRIAFMGVIFPVIPVPVSYSSRGYGGARANLRVDVRASRWHEPDPENTLLEVIAEGKSYPCEPWLRMGQNDFGGEIYVEGRRRIHHETFAYRLVCDFPLPRADTKEFDLKFTGWERDSSASAFGTLHFKRRVQKRFFIGP
jgi:hypothetical protein